MTRTRTREDSAFAELVRRDVFGETTLEEAAALRSPAQAERFLSYLLRVVQSTGEQLNQHRDGTRPRDEVWRRDAAVIKWRYGQRISEVRAIISEQSRKWVSGDVGALHVEMSRLRGAIRAHETATRAADVDPEPWDEELWAHVAKRPR